MLESVIKNYVMGKTIVRALRGIDLAVEEAEFVSIAGPSGSGKTTLLNLIGCLDEPTSGKITVCNQEVVGLSADKLSEIRAAKIGFIFQAFNLIPVLTALENVEYPLLLQKRKFKDGRERRKRATSLLESVQLAEFAHHFPNELSGGQMQRVAIARALVSEPKIVLADEPTANLDSQTGHLIIELMRRINREKGTTFVFSTHDPRVMELADKVVEITDGKITGVRASSILLNK